MGLFNKKKKINSLTMMHLIYETSKTKSTNIFEFFDRIGIIYDEQEAQINILSINIELCRYELYKNNKQDVVDNIITKAYDQFFFGLVIDKERMDYYRGIMNTIYNKLKEIFTAKKLLATKEEFVYRLLLEQLNINEQVIDKPYINEFMLYIRDWCNNAAGINASYQIEDSANDIKKNETIDFRF